MSDQHAYIGDPNFASQAGQGSGSNQEADLENCPENKPVRLADWHPTTIPDYEPPFRLHLGKPHKGQPVVHPITFFLSRQGGSKELAFEVGQECVKLGCTVIYNDALREAYWYSNASPRWLHWIVRAWDGWKRRTS